MRIIAFITEATVVRDILIQLGEPITPPTIAPARGPPLWEMPPAGQRAIDPQAQPAPDYAFDHASRGRTRKTTRRCRSSGTARALGPPSGPLRPPGGPKAVIASRLWAIPAVFSPSFR